MAGLHVVPVNTLQDGTLDLDDLKFKAVQHKDKLAAFMVRDTIFLGAL
jgi:glycine dehydrogenase